MSESASLLVCPKCRGPLATGNESMHCLKCAEQFSYENGFANLIVGERFDDDDDADRLAYERMSNEHLTKEYLLPTFTKLLEGVRKPKILSVGCGLGIDIDMFTDASYDIYGIDCGGRSKDWPARRHQDRLYLANGMSLPFADATFDLVYCGCVFPHVGVQGDSNIVKPNHWEERSRLAGEMARVLRPGGKVFVSSPNRWFPLDLFHGRSPTQTMPRLNPPTSEFLLSAGDYQRMFGAANCGDCEALPVQGYWGFHRMKRSFKGRLMAAPVEAVFNAVSQPALSFLRTTMISPWLALTMKKLGNS